MAAVQVLRNPAVSAAASAPGVCSVAILDHEGKRLVATGSNEGLVTVVDGAPRPMSRSRRNSVPMKARTRFSKKIHRKRVTGVHLHKGRDISVVTCSQDSNCEVYDVFGGDETASMTYHSGGINCMAVAVITNEALVDEAGGADVLLTGGADKTAKLWGLSGDNLCLRSYEGHRGGVCGVCVGGFNGKDFVVTCSQDKTVRVFGAHSEAKVYELPGATCAVYAPTLRNGRPVLLTGSAEGACAFSVPQDSDAADAWSLHDQTDAGHPRLLRHFARTSHIVVIRQSTLFDERRVVLTASKKLVELWTPRLEPGVIREPLVMDLLYAFQASGPVRDANLRPHAFLKADTAFTEPVVGSRRDLTLDVTVYLMSCAGLKQLDPAKQLEPYIVARSCRSDGKPAEVLRTRNVRGTDCEFPSKDVEFRFVVKIPVYDEGYVLTCAIYDFDRTRNKHFACGVAKFAASELLGGPDELTRRLVLATSKQLSAQGSLAIRLDRGDGAVPHCACELIACTLQGHVDHALLYGFAPLPPPLPVTPPGQEIILETALVQFDYAPKNADEIGLVYREKVAVLKKGPDGWWFGRRTAWNARKDSCWDEEGWFPAAYVDGDFYARKNAAITGGRAGLDDWETVHTSSSESEEDAAPSCV